MSDTEWTPPAEAVGVAALAVAGAMACDAPCEDCEASARAALVAARPALVAEALAGLSRRSLELMALERDQARDQRDAAVGTLAAVAALADEWQAAHDRVCKGTDPDIPISKRHAHDCGITREDVAGRLRAAFADHADNQVIDDRVWACGRCGGAPESHAAPSSQCVWDPVLTDAIANFRAPAWDEGWAARAEYAERRDVPTNWPDLNPYRTTEGDRDE